MRSDRLMRSDTSLAKLGRIAYGAARALWVAPGRVRSVALTMALYLISAFPGANAQDYPNRSVKIVVGYVAGGGPDAVARSLALELSKVLGQPFVVENRPGAGGTLSTKQVAAAPADGYTLLAGETGQLVIAPFLFKSLSYDPVKDLTPIGLATTEILLMVSNPKTNIKTIQDLTREAKANPGKLNYGSSGLGSIHHIAMEAFKADAGINITHVPYKGSGQSVPALLGGEVQILMTGYTAMWPQIVAGSANLLAVTSPRRFRGAPDTPALSEVVKGYDFTSEVGLLGPAGLPPEVVDKLSNALRTVLSKPDVRTKLEAGSRQVTWSTAGEYAESIQQSLKRYQRAVKLANIQPM